MAIMINMNLTINISKALETQFLIETSFKLKKNKAFPRFMSKF